MAEKYYLCIEMSGKGSISRMSDECLMKGKSGSLYFGEYQAGMRKFTLAVKATQSVMIAVERVIICFDKSAAKSYDFLILSFFSIS